MALSCVSVVIPTRNRGEAIKATIDSACQQVGVEVEVIVVSDGSTDETDEVVTAYGGEVRLIRLDGAGHPSLARNAGLEEVRAPVVAYLDHDDVWAPSHLSGLCALLDQGADVAVAGASRAHDDGSEGPPTRPIDLVWHPELQLAAPLFEPSRVAHRAEWAARAGGWPTGQKGLEDWGMWCQLADAGARFATSCLATCQVQLSSTSRRHQLLPRFVLVLGRAGERRPLEEAQVLLAGPQVRAAIWEEELADRRAWYKDIAAELVFPYGVGMDDVLAALAPGAPLPPPMPTAVAPIADGFALVQPVFCSGPEHANRLRALLSRRLPRALAAVRRAVAGVCPGVESDAPEGAWP